MRRPGQTHPLARGKRLYSYEETGGKKGQIATLRDKAGNLFFLSRGGKKQQGGGKKEHSRRKIFSRSKGARGIGKISFSRTLLSYETSCPRRPNGKKRKLPLLRKEKKKFAYY